MAGPVVIANALQEPTSGTIDRVPGSARRTSNLDMVPRGAAMVDGLEVRGAARDLRTDDTGAGVVVAEASLVADVGPMRTLRSLTTTPALPALDALAGRPIARGFRAAADAAIPDEAAAQTPLYLLVDDLPIAALIAGYADLYAHPERLAHRDAGSTRAEICAGWASDATMAETIAATGYIPIPEGPVAPALERADDPLAWHPLPALPVGSMRRRRLVDVRPAATGSDGECLEVRAMFRDVYARDGFEQVLHEYTLEATVDGGVFTRCEATPRVLPWPECPTAAASAGDLVGRSVAGARDHVRHHVRGLRSCTHLSDLLCTLADVVPLARLVRLVPEG